MQIALLDGTRQKAVSGAKGVCPLCGASVLARCGDVNAHHWAHESLNECYGEPETEWHAEWKGRFEMEFVEVVHGPHRADVLYKGTVYEFQSKPLPAVEMNERGKYWSDLGYRFIWIINMRESAENLVINVHAGYVSFRWKWPKRSRATAWRFCWASVRKR